MTRLAWIALLAVTAEVSIAHAFEPPPLTGYVNDQARLLLPDTRRRIEQRLAEFHAARGPQFVLLTIKSLGGMTVEEYSIETVEAWKLGDAQRDDGLLMLIAKQDRKIRIEVGHGLEGVIPDAIATRVIREILTPAFKQGDFAWGIEAAFNELIVKAGGLSVPTKALRKRTAGALSNASIVWFAVGFSFGLPFLGLLLLAVLSKYHRQPSELKHGSGIDAETGKMQTTDEMSERGPSRSSSMRYSSRGSSSSRRSSSSRARGGGGSFGGGGASGSW